MSRLTRQSFLGPESDLVLEATTIALVGLGGGGSHIVQQLNHVGIGGFTLIDPDTITESNTNRLVGGTLKDLEVNNPKVAIAERMIQGLQPRARVLCIQDKWQSNVDVLKICDVIVAAVDSFMERDQLERFARRHLIPYIDIGMKVTQLEKRFLISGQVILSTTGSPCLRCCGIVTDENIKREAEQYGDAGEQPQVVWPNGVLASTAVGLAIQLLTPWFPEPPMFVYLEYDGNKGTVAESKKINFLREQPCLHHPLNETGDLFFDIRKHLKMLQEPDPVGVVQEPVKVSWWQKLLALFSKK